MKPPSVVLLVVHESVLADAGFGLLRIVCDLERADGGRVVFRER